MLVENDNAAGHLWDMSAGELKRGDYQLIVRYGDFLSQQPELMQLAEQLGRSREAKAVPKKDAPMETFRSLVREPATVPSRSTVFSKATIFYVCCRLSWPPSASPSWSLSSTASWLKSSC